MSLPPAIIQVLAQFQPAFTRPTWEKVLVLVVGTLLARGRRTVTVALRHMGLQHERSFSSFHQVLNRARWSSLAVSRRLLDVLVTTFVPAGASVELVIDETLERRWGAKIRKRGHYRDQRLSSKAQSVSNSGLRWVSMMVVTSVPWTRRLWALPFLSVLATTPKVSEALGQRHKTVGQLAQQMVLVVRRWLPGIPLKLIGDTAYSIVELGLCCRKHGVTLIAPLRLDAALYAPAPPRTPGTLGRPRVKGAALPKLHTLLTQATTWQKMKVCWYDGSTYPLEMLTGTAVWYRIGLPALPIRWVLTRDPAGKREPRAYFSTDPNQAATAMVQDFIKRWTIEVTFEETRAHLGVETQRQWSDLAIERTTPCLLGLYSLVALWGDALYPDGNLPFATAAWYPKPEATFSDLLAEVRRQLWGNFSFHTSPTDPDALLVPRSDLARLAYAVCY